MSGKSDFKINSKFAEKYDKYRQKEELQRRKCDFPSLLASKPAV